MDSWNDYCLGSSYKLQYVSGPKLLAGDDPLTIDINQFYTDKTKYNTPGFASPDPYLEGTIPDLTWEGLHTVKIVAQQGNNAKKYRIVESPNFTINYKNPCKAAIVTANPVPGLTYTVGDANAVSKIYEEFKDDASTLYGNGYNKCG